MAHDPEGVVAFEAAVNGKSQKFTAVFGFRAMKAVESHYDLPFFKALQSVMPELSAEDLDDPVKIVEAGASVRMTDVGNLFRFALLKHHPKLTDDDVEEIVDAVGLDQVGEIIGQAVASALHKEGAKSGTGNPPKNKSRKSRTGIS